MIGLERASRGPVRPARPQLERPKAGKFELESLFIRRRFCWVVGVSFLDVCSREAALKTKG